jgi:transposase
LADHEPRYAIADKGYNNSDELVRHVEKRGNTAVIPSRSGRTTPRRLLKQQYRRHNHVERFVSRIKHFRRVATRYAIPARNFLGFIKFAALFSWLSNVNRT